MSFWTWTIFYNINIRVRILCMAYVVPRYCYGIPRLIQKSWVLSLDLNILGQETGYLSVLSHFQGWTSWDDISATSYCAGRHWKGCRLNYSIPSCTLAYRWLGRAWASPTWIPHQVHESVVIGFYIFFLIPNLLRKSWMHYQNGNIYCTMCTINRRATIKTGVTVHGI